MAQQDVELILVRRWASMLTVPVFLVGAQGDLLYFNESAEPLLGKRFEESGPMPLEELGSIFDARDADGEPIPPSELPLGVALLERKPGHGTIRIRALDGVRRAIGVTAIPLEGQGRRFLGALAIFWEVDEA